MNRRLTAIVERDGDGYVALCPEVDVASQGGTVAEARDNLEVHRRGSIRPTPNGAPKRLVYRVLGQEL